MVNKNIKICCTAPKQDGGAVSHRTKLIFHRQIQTGRAGAVELFQRVSRVTPDGLARRSRSPKRKPPGFRLRLNLPPPSTSTSRTHLGVNLQGLSAGYLSVQPPSCTATPTANGFSPPLRAFTQVLRLVGHPPFTPCKSNPSFGPRPPPAPQALHTRPSVYNQAACLPACTLPSTATDLPTLQPACDPLVGSSLAAAPLTHRLVGKATRPSLTGAPATGCLPHNTSTSTPHRRSQPPTQPSTRSASRLTLPQP